MCLIKFTEISVHSILSNLLDLGLHFLQSTAKWLSLIFYEFFIRALQIPIKVRLRRGDCGNRNPILLLIIYLRFWSTVVCRVNYQPTGGDQDRQIKTEVRYVILGIVFKNYVNNRHQVINKLKKKNIISSAISIDKLMW